MDILSLLRMMGALAAVLGLLAGALWIVRRYDIRLPGTFGTTAGRRLAVIERSAIDSRRSVALIRRDGREHLLLISPEGNLVIESGIVRDSIDHQAAEAEAKEAERRLAATQAAAAHAQESFHQLVTKVLEKSARVKARLKGQGKTDA